MRSFSDHSESSRGLMPCGQACKAATFDRGRPGATISLTQPSIVDGMQVHLVIPNNTVIDGAIHGGGQITLDGTQSGMVALVDQGSTVVLRNLQIIGGRANDKDTPAGGIANFGGLFVENVTLVFCTGGYSPEASSTAPTPSSFSTAPFP